MISCLVIDVNGMLIKSPEPFSHKLAREYNLSLEQIEPFFKGPFKRCLTGHANITLVIKPYLREWGWQGSVEEFLNKWFRFESNLDQELSTQINKIKKTGVSVYLATNQEKYRLHYLADELALIHEFDHLFASCEIGYTKPSFEFFQYMFKSLQYLDTLKTPAEVMYWDDESVNIKAAKKYGFDSHQYGNNNDFIQKTNLAFRINS